MQTKQYQPHPIYIAAYIGVLLIMYSMSACVSYSPYNPYAPRDISDPVRSPKFEDAKVSCAYEPSVSDYVWHFEAWIQYPRHDFGNIKRVYVEVYEGEYLVKVFELYREKGKHWDTKRMEANSKALYCEYFDDYEADFFAFDHKEEYDIFTVQDFNTQ
jgi:hypothetical protein